MSIYISNVQGLFETAEGSLTLRKADVYIADGRIQRIDGDIPQADRHIDGRERVLLPGLINSHTHIPMTILRNAADDLTFHDWLFGRILPLEDQLTGSDCYWGTQLGIMEMLRTGTTCFLDMYFHLDDIARAVCDAGMRAVLSRGLMSGYNGAQSLHEAVELTERWGDRENLSFFLAPHAAYTCDLDFQREIAETAKGLGLGIHTHISESKREVEENWAQHGKSPVALMDETGLLGSHTVAAHCVHLDDADIALLAERGVHVAHNPVSNLKLANGIARVPELRAAGVNVCLGTDGAASNNTLNLFRELSFATLLHKGTTGDPQAVTAIDGLKMATTNGARALGLDGIIGKLQVGYAADLTLLSLDPLNMQPANDSLSALAYSSGGHEVELTMVAGQILYEKGSFPTIDAERVLYEVEQTCKRIGLRA